MQTESKSPLLKITPIKLIKCGEMDFLLTYKLHSSVLFGTGRFSANYPRRKINTKRAKNPFIYNDALPRLCTNKPWHKIFWNNQQYLF